MATRILLLVVIVVPAAIAAEPDYDREVKPILRAHCFRCHGVRKQEADLRLDTAVAALKGSENGQVIVPSQPDKSRLLHRVRSRDKETRMPPEGAALSAREIATLAAWIGSGAKHPDNELPESDPTDHWAFRPPVRPAVPGPADSTWIRNPIDAFVATQHRQKGLVHSGPASPAVLLRRATLDLVGLPPTPAELTAFLSDNRPDRWNHAINRLLQNPRHGERWGRHWMDVWRYSDWYGYQKQLRNSSRHIWRWRDWIVDSLNADRPYDEMVQQMLAADELPGATSETLRATGFLARNYYLFNRNTWLDATIEHTGKAFLGLTINCARCHDHMFDPVAQKDYYQFRAIFEPHQIRTDPIDGAMDTETRGLSLAYDAKLDTPTYLFERGNDKRPDKNHPLAASVPEFLKVKQTFQVTPVQLPATTYYPGARASVRRALLSQAEATVALRQKELASANKAVRSSTTKTKAPPPPTAAPIAGPPFLADDFSAPRPQLWKMTTGKWTWKKSRLVQSQVADTRQMCSTTKPHPADFSVTLKLKILGGKTYHSVGIGFDGVDSDNLLAVYLSAFPKGAKIQFTRVVNGKATYPTDGQRRLELQRNRDYELRLDVRGQWLNAWVDGKRQLVFRLPSRRTGTLSIWTYDSAAEFDSIRAGGLNPKFVLAQTPTAPKTAVVDLQQARLNQDTSAKRDEAARAALASLQARIAADEVRLSGSPSDQSSALSLKAARLHRLSVLRKAEADRAANVAEQRRATEIKDNKALAKARTQRKQLDKQLQQAQQAVTSKKMDPSYPPLTKTYPSTSTGRRLALARWITDRRNPLAARVCVNHIWMRHFGSPLVTSVFDFGNNGRRPVFPALLDWLAVELIESGWDMKHLHRLMMTSSAYRMSSSLSPPQSESRDRDPDNNYLWRMNSKRLESELVRDGVLWVCGGLDTRMGGPELDAGTGLSTSRRSIYYRHAPEKMMTFLDIFDSASTHECYRRSETVVPQQALALVNSRMAIEQSRHLARRLDQAIGLENTRANNLRFLETVFMKILGRGPSEAERTVCLEFLAGQALLLAQPKKLTPFGKGQKISVPPAAQPHLRARENLVLVLLNHNEFLTIR